MESIPSPADQLAVLRGSRTVAIVAGVITLIAGVVVLAWPGETAKTLAVIVGIFLAISGVAQIIDALVTRRAGTYWGLLLLHGVLDLAIGLVAIFWPTITIWVLVVLLGIELILGGILSLVVAWRMPKELEQHSRNLWRGIFSVAVGLVVLFWPKATVWVIVVVFGIYLVLFGLLLLFAGFQLGKAERAAPAA